MAESERPGAPPGPLESGAPLDERERLVLAELAREVDAWVSFQGLRRQLGVHQQALSRTLRRLEGDGLVSHEGRGYQLTDRGASLLRGHAVGGPGAGHVRFVEALLPPHVGAGDVTRLLARRWFGGLRWYAQSEGPGETALHWIAEPSRARVTVRVGASSLTLEVQPDPADPQRGFAAVRPLLQALSELYGIPPPRPEAGVLAFTSGDAFGPFHGAGGFPAT